MDILIYRYGSICEPDYIWGFTQLGNNVHELTYEIEDKNIPIQRLLELVGTEMQKYHYDFVFSVNFYPFLSELCNIFKIRYLCQTVDSPVMELYSYSISNPWNRIFVFDSAQYRMIAPKNPGNVFHLPLATNTNRWDQVISQATTIEHQHFSSDISFVGSLYTEKCPYNQLKDAPAYLLGYLNGIMDVQLKIYGYNLIREVLPDSIVSDFKNHMPDFYIPAEASECDERSIVSDYYIDNKISAMEREHLMQLIGSRFSLDLYTGSETSHLPVNNRGLVKTHTEMPLVFHNSKINLNITSKGIHDGLPLRIFDILGCGGFLITNYQTELPSIFCIGEDLDAYSSDEELLTKIEYYLSHPKERADIAENGSRKVHALHNYPERLLTMISLAFGINTQEVF